MSRTVSVKFQPSTIERITAGAATITLHERPREIRNRAAVSVRVFRSNRPSRYSYAV
jgi:hypothetical protein